MRALFDPDYWRAVARNPAAIIGLVADLAPVIAVLFWGWGAGALVLLYWLENVVIGAITVPRILLAGIGKRGPIGLFGASFTTAFFVFHYGIFCFVHGAMLLSFFHNDNSWSSGSDMGVMMVRLLSGSLGYARHMDWVLALIIAAHVVVLVRDYILGGEWKKTSPDEEMAAPYGRVIVLHVAVFVVGGALSALGDPMIGALALVLARAWWGLHSKMQPRKPAAPPAAVAV